MSYFISSANSDRDPRGDLDAAVSKFGLGQANTAAQILEPGMITQAVELGAEQMHR